MNTSEFKKEISSDWKSIFPQLSFYSPTKLCITFDIIVVSLHLFRIPNMNMYRPIFEIYSFWKTNNKDIFSYPPLYREISNKKGLQFDIKYPLHTYYLEEATRCVQEQVGTYLNPEISIMQLIDFIDYHDKTDILLQYNDSFHKPLLELELYLARYTNDVMLVETVIKKIEKRSKKWNPKYLDTPVDEWKKKLYNRIDHWDEILKCVQQNMNAKKIAMLNKGHLIY